MVSLSYYWFCSCYIIERTYLWTLGQQSAYDLLADGESRCCVYNAISARSENNGMHAVSVIIRHNTQTVRFGTFQTTDCHLAVTVVSVGSGELHGLYRSLNIDRVIKSRRLAWIGHVAKMEEGK